MTLAEQYAELLNLTQLYLQQEHKKEEWIFSERSDFLYFKEIAQKNTTPKSKQDVPAQPKITAAPTSTQKSTYTPTQQPVKPPEPLLKPVVIEKPKPIAPAPVVEPKKAPSIPGAFVPELLPKTAQVDLSDIRQIMAEKFPHVAIINEIPQPIQSHGLADVILINVNDDPTHLEFLQKVAKAITDRFCSAEVCSITQFSNWEKLISSPHLKLILMVGTELDHYPDLKQYFRELPKHGRLLLGKVPFIPMAEISAYLTDIKQKSLLWKSVCDHLQT